MSENYKKYIYILGLCFIIISSIYSGSKYMNVDLMEARNFVTAREIVQSDNWLLPTMNGEPRLAKPPLPTWLTALSMKIAGTDSNLTANRLPAQFAALLMVFFIYLITKRMTGSRETAVYAAIVLSTSYMFMYMARKGTWDIFCHSFMLGAIWLYHEIVIARSRKYLLSLCAGILMGLSWMSKGPVSFYALLLPFIISHFIFYKSYYTKDFTKHLFIMFFTCTVISSAWPLYVYYHMSAEANNVVKGETVAWFSRHIKPFWYYMQFPAMSGIWIFIVLPMLWPPYAKRKISQVKSYKMLILWTVLIIILLSVIPEKKDRYLLPVTIPLSIIVSYYLKYLVNAFKKEVLGKDDRLMINIYISITAAFSVLITISVFYEFIAFGFSDNTLFYFLIAFIGNYATYRSLKDRSGRSYIYSIVFTFLVLINVMPPLTQTVIKPKEFMQLTKLRNILDSQPYPFYSYSNNMKYVWASGHKITKAKLNDIYLSSEDTIFYLTDKPINKEASFYKYEEVAKISGNNKDAKWSLYKLRK